MPCAEGSNRDYHRISLLQVIRMNLVGQETMSASDLQELFIDELISSIRASRKRLVTGLAEGSAIGGGPIEESFRELSADLSDEQKELLDRVFWDELRGVLHGFLVTLDGGTALADRGLIRICDEDGVEFDRHLHELAFSRLSNEELE